MTRCARRLLTALMACESNEEQVRVLGQLQTPELEFVLDDWSTWAHEQQLPPHWTNPERIWASWLILGGRGSGKTRAGAEWVRAEVRACSIEQPLRIALIGPSYAEAREVMVEGTSGLMSLNWHDLRPAFISSRRMICWPNGATAHLFSAEDPEELRGPQFHMAWLDGTVLSPATLLFPKIGCCFVA